MPTHYCKQCGKPLLSHHPNARYCDIDCHNLYGLIKHRAWVDRQIKILRQKIKLGDEG